MQSHSVKKVYLGRNINLGNLDRNKGYTHTDNAPYPKYPRSRKPCLVLGGLEILIEMTVL